MARKVQQASGIRLNGSRELANSLDHHRSRGALNSILY
jgi:hypothetical protein